MGRIFLAVVGLLVSTGCAPVVIVEPEREASGELGQGLPQECLPAGPVTPYPAPAAVAACSATCLTAGTACGTVDLGCGATAECGCGNPDDNECVSGHCQCVPAPEAEACALCPGRVARYCGEGSPKTQDGCERLDAGIGDRRVWCCAQ